MANSQSSKCSKMVAHIWSSSYDITIRFQVEDVKENYLRLRTRVEGKMGEMDGDEENMKSLMDVANELLDEKAKCRDAVTGEVEDKTYMGTNREALSCFAKWLSIDKKARENPTVDPAIAPAPETKTGTFV